MGVNWADGSSTLGWISQRLMRCRTWERWKICDKPPMLYISHTCQVPWGSQRVNDPLIWSASHPPYQAMPTEGIASPFCLFFFLTQDIIMYSVLWAHITNLLILTYVNPPSPIECLYMIMLVDTSLHHLEIVCGCWHIVGGKERWDALVCLLEGVRQLKPRLFLSRRCGNQSVNSWLFRHISKIRARPGLNDSFHRNTNIVGGDQTRRRDQPPPPLCHPMSFQPPTAEVGGSVVTKYDRDRDPQRSRASHPIPDREPRRWASEEGGALWIPDERINRAWETRRCGSRCVWGGRPLLSDRFTPPSLPHFCLSLWIWNPQSPSHLFNVFASPARHSFVSRVPGEERHFG